MKTINSASPNTISALLAATLAAVILSACASAPAVPDGAAAARNRFSQLQANPELAGRAPVAMQEAELAVRRAELGGRDPETINHLVYIADRKVDTAAALARTALLEDQRQALSQQRDAARLEARTREADRNASNLAGAKVALAEQRRSNEALRGEADAAHAAADDASARSAQLQQQLDDLNARPTDRGIVLTLGDVLFTSGKAELKPGAAGHLGKLALFLDKYPDRTVLIEGHTDSIGTDDYNVDLSRRRAEAVRDYLTGQGIGAVRLTTAGRGKSEPVADNASASGREQNRRVEVVISNPPVVSR